MGDKLTPVTKENVEGLLNDLLVKGEYPEAVAKVLKSKRIKGLRRAAEDCPIENYLRKRLALGRGGVVSVGTKCVVVFTNKVEVHAEIPVAIVEFIHEFDNLLKYPELEIVR